MKIINGEDLKDMKFVLTDDGCLKEYKQQGRFVPKENEKYFYINSSGYIDSYTNSKHEIDNYIIAHNLVFKTKKEAEDYKWFLDMLDKNKSDFSKEEWENNIINKYSLGFNHTNQNIEMNYSCYNQFACNDIFFTKENIDKFIEIVGEERIKKYMFDIWE